MFVLPSSGNAVWELDEELTWQVMNCPRLLVLSHASRTVALMQTVTNCIFNKEMETCLQQGYYRVPSVMSLHWKYISYNSTRDQPVSSQTSFPVVQSNLTSQRRHLIEIPTRLTISQILEKGQESVKEHSCASPHMSGASGNIISLSQSQRNCPNVCFSVVCALMVQHCLILKN